MVFSLRLSLLAMLCVACVSDFDDRRAVGSRGTLGEELYGITCDRVGAQSLREDVTGASYDGLCHRAKDGSFDDRVDGARLPPVSKAGEATRERGIRRLEALATERDPLIGALDAMLPDVALGTGTVSPEQDMPRPELHTALRDALSDLLPLYEDDTIPGFTRALGGLLRELEADPVLARAFSRLEARHGYRPDALALYVLRPIFAYPRLFDLGGEMALAHRGNVKGVRTALAQVIDELGRTLQQPPTAEARPMPLVRSTDPLTLRSLSSRPREGRELALELLSTQLSRRAEDALFVVARDVRGVAQVARRRGQMPYPFMEDVTGQAATDGVGRLITQDGRPAPLPFAAPGAQDRDARGRALGVDGELLYAYLDVSSSVLSELSQPLSLAATPRIDGGSEALLDVFELAQPLLGTETAKGTFDPETSPLVDVAHALGVTLRKPELDDLLALFAELARTRPELLSRLTQLALSLDAIADRYPEVALPRSSTLWDELIDVFAEIAQNPGLLEDLLSAFLDVRTEELGPVFASYMRYRDHITYFRDPNALTSFDSLNGPVWNATRGDFSDMGTPVDRDAADSGMNRSILQRFLSLLHDANGLTACSKKGAIAHVDVFWPPGTSALPIRLDYPTSPLAKTVCAFLGSRAPAEIPECGILRFDDVAALIVDVALGRTKIEVRDDCLARLVSSPLTGLVGGANAFLEDTSGIRGFGLDPTVPGVARLTFFDTPYDAWGGSAGDIYYPKTSRFLKDVIDPVPSTVCEPELYTDPLDGSVLTMRRCERFEDTLRGRDPDGLFPLEQLGFLDKLIPLAEAFGDHDATRSFVRLLDVLHRHWGSPRQTKLECDPSLPSDHARYCTQDGVVAYEPMLAEMLQETSVFAEIGAVMRILSEAEVAHCTAYDDAGLCLNAEPRNGIVVLAEAVRALVDPLRNQGLKDRHGETRARRNDGSFSAQTTPLLLWLDAMNAIDRGFAGAAESQKVYRAARSSLIDTFLSIEARDGEPRFRYAAIDALLPRVIDLLREQVRAHCPVPAGRCAWAEEQLATSMADIVSDPLTARVVALTDAVWAVPGLRDELARFVAYLTQVDPRVAPKESLQAALLDLLQTLADDEAFEPLSAWLGRALSGQPGQPASDALVPRVLALLSRFFDAPEAPSMSSIDPHHAFAEVLSRAVTPMPGASRAPLEVLIDVMWRVNRLDPRQAGDYAPEDYAMLAKELSALLLDPESGLEQVYALLEQVTRSAP